MLTYPGRDLFTKIDKIVSKAFYTDYLYCENNWYHIEEIIMTYIDMVPMITVNATFGCDSGIHEFSVDLFLDRSDDFNAGIVLVEIEKQDE